MASIQTKGLFTPIHSMNQKADIHYPTSWTYKIIASSIIEIERAVAYVLKEKERSLSPSKTSSEGKFVSMELNTHVISDKERTAIFHKIYSQPGVKMVL